MHRVIDGVRPRTTGRPRFKMKTFRITDPAPIEYTPRKTLERFGLLHIKFQHIAGVMDTPLKLNHRVVTLAGPWLRFKTGDAIKFLLAHNDRHLKQATRAIQDPGRQTHLFF